VVRGVAITLLCAVACKAPAPAPAATTPPVAAAEESAEEAEPVVSEPAVAQAEPVVTPESEVEKARPPRPGVERLEAWIDTKTIGTSLYAKNTLAILDEFPFFVFQDGGLDPLRDIEYIHVSGPPYGVHGLEIAARHKLKRAALQQVFERVMSAHGLTVAWSGSAGTTAPAGPGGGDLYDTFEVVLPDKQHAVLTENRARAEAAVNRLEVFRAKKRGVALAVDFHGVTGWLPRGDGSTLVLPRKVALRVDASKTPKPHVELEFADEAQAAAAHDYLLVDVKNLVESRADFRFSIGPLYDSAKIDRRSNVVTIDVELEATQANLMLTIADGLIDQATPDDATRDARRTELRKSSAPR
jgi:hypothetical protein